MAALQLFLSYGLASGTPLPFQINDLKGKSLTSNGLESGLGKSRKSAAGPYRPPHLRKKDGLIKNPVDTQCSDYLSPNFCFTSSDSDHSDNDGSAKHVDRYRSSKVRLAALVCIQVLFLAHTQLYLKDGSIALLVTKKCRFDLFTLMLGVCFFVRKN